MEKLELDEKDDLREVSGDLTNSSLSPILGIDVLTFCDFECFVSLCCVTGSTFFMMHNLLEMIFRKKIFSYLWLFFFRLLKKEELMITSLQK